MSSTYLCPDEWDEKLVRAMDDVIDDEEEPETHEAWVRCYEIACARMEKLKINH